MHLIPIIKNHWKTLAASIIVAELVGLVSSLLAGNMQKAYCSVVLPPGAPLPWVYVVVWVILYALIGFAAFTIYFSYENAKKRRSGLWLYVVQLILLFLWPIMFFRYDFRWSGLLLLIVLEIITIFIIKLFWFNRKIAAVLMGILFLWLLFAIYLNIGIIVLN